MSLGHYSILAFFRKLEPIKKEKFTGDMEKIPKTTKLPHLDI
jgi:hypothetical protein